MAQLWQSVGVRLLRMSARSFAATASRNGVRPRRAPLATGGGAELITCSSRSRPASSSSSVRNGAEPTAWVGLMMPMTC